MPNFAIATEEHVISKGMDLINKLAQPGEKKGETLARLFSIVEEKLDGEVMKRSGVDVAALDASLSNIRSMFISSISGREELEISYAKSISELKDKILIIEEERDRGIREAKADVDRYEQKAILASNSMLKLDKERKALEDQLSTTQDLIAEIRKSNESLAKELASLKGELSAKNEALQKMSVVSEKVRELESILERERMQAAFDLENALLKKDAEYKDRIYQLEKENVELKRTVKEER